MADIQLEFPIWVRYKNGQYVVGPLLFQGPARSDERFENAIRKMRNEIGNQFRGEYILNRNSLQHLLWYAFNPDFRFKTADMNFEYGSRFFSGKISIAWFSYMGQTLVVLPAFDHHLFVASTPNAKEGDVVDEAMEQIRVLAREYKKEFKGEFDLKPFASTKGEYCSIYDQHLHIREEKISFEADGGFSFRQFFRQRTDFNGRYEVTRVGEELNVLYPGSLSRAFYSDEVISQLSPFIYGRENIPLVILGNRKVGKTTILHEAVYRHLELHKETRFHEIDNIWHIDPTRIISGMSIVGMWQKRFESILDFVIRPLPQKERQDKLYFNNVIALFRVGKSAQNNMTLSDVLKPYLQKRDLQVILEATPEEWDVANELDRGFTDLFKVFRFYPPDESTSLRIIGKIRSKLEHDYKLSIDNLGLLRLVELHRQFYKNQGLVGGVAENLNQLAAKYAGRSIDSNTVLKEFSSRTHLNQRLADRNVIIEKDEFENHISQKLIGQPEAVDCLVDALHAIKSQLNNPERPYGSFLFIGPTGVGKTQAAKILADYLFTHEDRLVRFDMNEYIDSHAVSRLVGDFDRPEGQLTSKIRFNPFCVLLFDEIEKAHPDVHNLLLQVLGEGRLTDALGKEVNFCNTVIIMTSNLGAGRVGKEITLKRTRAGAAGTYQKAVRDFFRPEFINRIDKTVIFEKLSSKHIGQIAWLQIKDLLKRHGFARRHTILNVTPEALESIAASGFDSEMGGRALKRQIEKDITVILADKLVEALPDNPVIIDLALHKGKLVPFLTILEHMPALAQGFFPDYGAQEINVSHFQGLLDEVTRIKEEIRNKEEEEFEEGPVRIEDFVNTEYQLKEDLHALEERLIDIIWEYNNRRKITLKGSNFNLKAITRKATSLAEHLNEKVYLRDLYNKLQVSEFLNEISKESDLALKGPGVLFFEMAHLLAWVSFFHHYNNEGKKDSVLLRIASCVENQGSAEVARLNLLYRKIHRADSIFKEKENTLYVHMTGPGVYDLFQQEVGYHMFLGSFTTPVPIRVDLIRVPEEATLSDFVDEIDASFQAMHLQQGEDGSYSKTGKVVRLYVKNRSHPEGDNMTDLRTGLITPFGSETRDFQLLFYANFDNRFKYNIEQTHEND